MEIEERLSMDFPFVFYLSPDWRLESDTGTFGGLWRRNTFRHGKQVSTRTKYATPRYAMSNFLQGGYWWLLDMSQSSRRTTSQQDGQQGQSQRGDLSDSLSMTSFGGPNIYPNGKTTMPISYYGTPTAVAIHHNNNDDRFDISRRSTRDHSQKLDADEIRSLSGHSFNPIRSPFSHFDKPTIYQPELIGSSNDRTTINWSST